VGTTQNVSSAPQGSTKIKQDNRKHARLARLVLLLTRAASAAPTAFLADTLKNPRHPVQSACLEKHNHHQSPHHANHAVQELLHTQTAKAVLHVLLERFKMQLSTCHLARYARVVTFAAMMMIQRQHQSANDVR
jgi:hypothetical protein